MKVGDFIQATITNPGGSYITYGIIKSIDNNYFLYLKIHEDMIDEESPNNCGKVYGMYISEMLDMDCKIITDKGLINKLKKLMVFS